MDCLYATDNHTPRAKQTQIQPQHFIHLSHVRMGFVLRSLLRHLDNRFSFRFVFRR